MDQLTRRTNELDAREQYIVTREQLSAGLDRDILKQEQRAKSITAHIISLEETVAFKIESIAQGNHQLEELNTVYESKVIEFRAELASTQSRLDDIAELTRQARTDLNAVKQAITERQQYQSQQETLIADSIEAGNTHLRGIDYEVTEAQQVLRDLKTSARTIRQDKKLLEQDLDAAREAFISDANILQEQFDSLQLVNVELDGKNTILLKTIADSESYLQNAELELDSKFRKLDIKERELLLKRNAIIADRQELDTDMRRWTGTKSLYNVE